MKTRIFIAALLMLITYSCVDLCKLTSDDKDWLLVDYKSLNYLENDNKTIKIDIDNDFGSSYGSAGWFPSGEGWEWGKSTFYMRDSLYWILINSTACDKSGTVSLFTRKNMNYSLEHVIGFNYYKDSLVSTKKN